MRPEIVRKKRTGKKLARPAAKIAIRLARPADVARLAALNAGRETAYRAGNVKKFAPLVAQKQVLCALVKGEIAGLLCWRDFLGREGQWYLEQITVDEGWRRQGIGLALIGYFLAYAKRRGALKVFSIVQNGNRPSLRLHRTTGFIRSGSIAGLRQSRDKRIILRCELH
jgi:L-amino acid N-acyltransferase YncA